MAIGFGLLAARRADGSVAAPASLVECLNAAPIRPRETVVVYGTGFGPTSPEAPADQTLNSALPLANVAKVLLDTHEVSVAFAGLVSPGLYQCNFVVLEIPDGDYALTASVGGVRTAKIARMRIQK